MDDVERVIRYGGVLPNGTVVSAWFPRRMDATMPDLTDALDGEQPRASGPEPEPGPTASGAS